MGSACQHEEQADDCGPAADCCQGVAHGYIIARGVSSLTIAMTGGLRRPVLANFASVHRRDKPLASATSLPPALFPLLTEGQISSGGKTQPLNHELRLIAPICDIGDQRHQLKQPRESGRPSVRGTSRRICRALWYGAGTDESRSADLRSARRNNLRFGPTESAWGLFIQRTIRPEQVARGAAVRTASSAAPKAAFRDPCLSSFVPCLKCDIFKIVQICGALTVLSPHVIFPKQVTLVTGDLP